MLSNFNINKNYEKEVINILYVSSFCSSKLITEMFEAGYKPIQAIQKFNTLLVRGLVENGCNVYALSQIPKTAIPKFYSRRKETEKGIRFKYSINIDIKLVYNLNMFLSAFFLTLIWGIRQSKKENVAIFDILQTEFCAGSLLACKLCGIKAVAIVTDLPNLPGMLQKGKRGMIHRSLENILDSYANSFDGYILLTEQMNEVVNRKGRPFMIMEGLCDVNMVHHNVEYDQVDKKIVIYAGGLHEEYGIKSLVDGFRKLNKSDIELHLFGHGPMVEDIEQLMSEDNRIKYFGIVPNSKVVEAELQATLLVNPRPTVEDFTKYSFPSKNIEYMVSGTPILTTVLAGMPREYHEYVYLLEDESTNGIHDKLKELLLDTPQEELRLKGRRAKEFVLENKNNIYQANRIIDFIKTNWIQLESSNIA